MYGLPAPEIIHAEMFAVLPEEYQVVSKRPRSPTRQSTGGTVLEGPCFDRLGLLYFCDIPHGRVFSASSDGIVSLVTEYDGEPNGLAIGPCGRIFIADHKHGIMILDGPGKLPVPYITGPQGGKFKGVNDLTFDRAGNLYFTDQGTTGMHDPSGLLYKLAPSGVLTAILSNVPSPNGLAFNETRNLIYVAATRSSSIWLAPLRKDEALSKVGIFARLPGGGPDGLAIDANGNLAVAHPSLNTIWLFNPQGIPIVRVLLAQGTHPTNIAYGGPDNHWLYITEGDTYSVQKVKMPFAGAQHG